jgi:hypothetical protein
VAHRSEVFNPPESRRSKSVVIPMQNRPVLFASWSAAFPPTDAQSILVPAEAATQRLWEKQTMPL